MPFVDVFNGKAFQLTTLTSYVNQLPHLPSTVRNLVDFRAVPVNTKTVAIEKRDEELELVPVSQRGGPIQRIDDARRDIRDVRAPRLALGDRIMADEVQDVRAAGTEAQMESVSQKVAERMTDLQRNLELTWENHALGAIQGIVPDADGTTLYDWYSIMGVSQPSEINFELTASDPDPGAINQKCQQVRRQMQRAAKGAFGPGTQIFAFAGDTFYDQLTNSAEVRETYRNRSREDGRILRENFGIGFDAVTYGGITFINYRGTDDNSTVAIDPTQAKFFPVGAMGVFDVAYTPGEFADTVNQPGRPMYALTIPDRDRGMFADVELYSYPLYICKRPQMLQRAVNA